MPGICFRTHLFSTDSEGDTTFCNGQPGSAAAEWARAVLAAQGIACRELIQEDYGWGFWLEHECAVWVAVSYAGGTRGDENDAPEWWLGASHEAPFYSLAQRKKRAEGRALASRVNAVLFEAVRSEPEMDVIEVEQGREAA